MLEEIVGVSFLNKDEKIFVIGFLHFVHKKCPLRALIWLSYNFPACVHLLSNLILSWIISQSKQPSQMVDVS